MNKKAVEQAFKDFDNGKRPSNYREAISWYVVGPEGKLYSTKAIWAMASGEELANFNTITARKHLAELEFSIVEINDLSQDKSFDFLVRDSLATGSAERKKRLDSSSKKTESVLTVTRVFKRNPDVVAERLHQARGICENCKKKAPFISKATGEPYLEVHHVIPLKDGGEDTLENTTALCPNCHRKFHHG